MLLNLHDIKAFLLSFSFRLKGGSSHSNDSTSTSDGDSVESVLQLVRYSSLHSAQFAFELIIYSILIPILAILSSEKALLFSWTDLVLNGFLTFIQVIPIFVLHQYE